MAKINEAASQGHIVVTGKFGAISRRPTEGPVSIVSRSHQRTAGKGGIFAHSPRGPPPAAERRKRSPLATCFPLAELAPTGRCAQRMSPALYSGQVWRRPDY